MLSQVAALSDCIGACERIVQTPVPLHYARHTSRLATIFIFTLPFVLTAEMGLLTVPCMATICWALFGIQEIGLFIEHCALDNGESFMDEMTDQVTPDLSVRLPQ